MKSCNWKYFSLVLLTVHSSILTLSMKYVRSSHSAPGNMFIPSTAVVMTEIVKFCACVALVYIEEKGNLQNIKNIFAEMVITTNSWDTLKIFAPSLCYLVQNNLLYIAITNLDAATCQVIYQFRILTTAAFSAVLLKRSIRPKQWLSLVLLLCGIAIVQVPENKSLISEQSSSGTSRFIGGLAALGASLMTGLGSVLLEKVLKGSNASTWVRNIQLSFISIPLGLLSVLLGDFKVVYEKGFFFGYDIFVVYVIFLQAAGGLIVAIVVKYADNIMKTFATSLSIVFSCIASIYLFNFELSLSFILGVFSVIFGIYLFNKNS